MRILCATDGGWRGDEEGENCEELAVGGWAGARGFMWAKGQVLSVLLVG